MKKNTLRNWALLCFMALFVPRILATQVLITCESRTACASGFTYVYTAGSIKKQSCADTELECVDVNFSYYVIDCEQDLFGDRCSTGTCISGTNVENICSDQQNECRYEMESYIQCGACKSSNCDNGLCMLMNDFEVCYQEDECKFDSYSAKIQNCPNGMDNTNKPCKCCLSGAVSGVNMGICTDILPFDSPQLRSMSSPAQSYETSIKTTVLSIVLLALVLIQGV